MNKKQKILDTVSLYESFESPKDELAKKGIYYITGEVDVDTLLEVHQDILLKHLNPSWNNDIQLIINSVGGSVSEGNSLIDLLDWVRMDVRTVAMGCCASMGACLACCGTHGKRIISPSASIMIHGATWGVYGTKAQIAAVSKEMEREHERDVSFWLKHSKYMTKEDIENYFLNEKHDVWMSAEEAINHGIFDLMSGQEVITKKKVKKNV
jgi:ATP-dependent Clp protease protease subunit